MRALDLPLACAFISFRDDTLDAYRSTYYLHVRRLPDLLCLGEASQDPATTAQVSSSPFHWSSVEAILQLNPDIFKTTQRLQSGGRVLGNMQLGCRNTITTTRRRDYSCQQREGS